MPRAASLMLAIFVGLAAGCRDELCVKTVTATCRCQDPLMPNLDSCQASADVVSCSPSATVDPCIVNPCCRLAPTDDGGARDAGRDLAAPADGPPADPSPDLAGAGG